MMYTSQDESTVSLPCNILLFPLIRRSGCNFDIIWILYYNIGYVNVLDIYSLGGT